MQEQKTIGNGYTQFRILYELEHIAKQYPAAKQYLKKILKLTAQMESKRYRVAVIGEFKRGKSSMINALLGSDVLPTDILPMTATVNRIVYGTKKEILIHFWDGSTQRAGINELVEYVTKKGERQAKIAKEIKEVEVFYPSVFCKNHIELLDTPGLNDEDPMTKVTLDVLKEIDAAIVVIAADKPFSMTERNLTIQLLEHPEIRNIIFVVTFIDKVSSKREEQNRIISFISKRIAEDTLQQARRQHGDEPGFLVKAQAVLGQPKVFAVSSSLAMKGFVYDDEEMLENSRIEEFKYSLLEVLTAAQGIDMVQKVSDMRKEAQNKIGIWQNQRQTQLSKEEELQQAAYQKCEAYAASSMQEVTNWLQETDWKLEQLGFDEVSGFQTGKMAALLRACFIVALSSLRRDSVTRQYIAWAIDKASDESLRIMEQRRRGLQETLEQTRSSYETLRKREYYSVAGTAWDIQAPATQMRTVVCAVPEFSWSGPLYPSQIDLEKVDIIPIINEQIVKSLNKYGEQCDKAISSFRVALLEMGKIDKDFFCTIKERFEKEKSQILLQQEINEKQYQQDRMRLEHME